MLIRIISSIVALPLLLFFVIKGGVYLELAVGGITLLALYEFYNALKKKFNPVIWPSFVFTVLFYWLFRTDAYLALAGCFMLYVTINLIIYVVDHERNTSDLALSILPVIYIVFFLYHVNLFSSFEQDYFIWLIFIVSWGSDSGAYFVGKKFGKRKLSPTVSPKKTIEGALGGMITAAALAFGLTYYYDPSMSVYMMMIGIFGSMISIFGDLVASKIKREIGIKDYGNIMPGHGGAMDRFDSLLLVTPFVFYMIELVLWIK